MVSLSFGRPPTLISDNSVPLPSLIDDEHLSSTTEGQQPRGMPSRMEFFVHAIKLLGIREKLPAANSEHSVTLGPVNSGKNLGSILDRNSSIDRFLETMPAHLRVSAYHSYPDQDAAQCFEMQGKVLRAR